MWLATCQVVLIKGDANYRRLLGDLHWAHDTDFAELMECVGAGALRFVAVALALASPPNPIAPMAAGAAPQVLARWDDGRRAPHLQERRARRR
jgi:hypothetical protein